MRNTITCQKTKIARIFIWQRCIRDRYYTVIYDDKDQEKAFREEIHSEYYTLSYIRCV